MYTSEVLEVNLSSCKLKVRPYSDNIIRVTYIPLPIEDLRDLDSSLIIVSKRKDTNFQLVQTDDLVHLSTKKLIVTVNIRDGTLSFYSRRNGKDLLSEISRDYDAVEILGERVYSFKQIFKLSTNERIYGLGQHAGFSAYTSYDRRGGVYYLVQRNTDVAVPFMVSSKGYGILWDVYSMVVADIRRNLATFWVECGKFGKYLDYYFIYGDTMDEVYSSYFSLCGKPQLLPKWAYGYWQSKERYATQNELLEVAREFRRRGIPIDIIVLDWKYWGKYGWNAFKFDEEAFPNPTAMTQELHDISVKILVSIWPIVEEGTEVYREGVESGCVIPVRSDILGKGVSTVAALEDRRIPLTGLINVFTDRCREWFWGKIKEVFYDRGFDGWWLDASEPAVALGLIHDTWPRVLDIGDGKMFKYLNVYPLLESKAVYEGQRSISDRRVVILTRSFFVSQQRYATVVWSGDVTGDWATFRTQVREGLNASLSGIVYWTTDTGGFWSGNPGTDSYRELFIRWLQWSTFCPVMRVHGTNYPKEPWVFGKPWEDIIIKYIKLRYRLLPYIYSLAWRSYNDGYLIMRPLVLDFRDDEEVLDIEDQFMLGPYMMICPITTPSTRKREIYLPKGLWYDFWTGKKFEGGRYVVAEAPLDIIPIYVRAGALIPLALITQNADAVCSNLELRIYRGSNTSFAIYEDDGRTYAYERGIYALIPITWNDEKCELTVEKAMGSFELPKIRIDVVLVDEGKGVGSEISRPDVVVFYDGKERKVISFR